MYRLDTVSFIHFYQVLMVVIMRREMLSFQPMFYLYSYEMHDTF